MRSRYDYMEESKVADIDKERFPDPLSITYNDIQFSQMPTSKIITEGDINKFWLYMHRNYNMTEMDDVLLNINGVPYIGTLEPGDIFFNVNAKDLENFSKQKIAGMEDM